MSTTTTVHEAPTTSPSSFSTALRRLSATTAAGGLLGLLVGGVGGRLAMFALARLNPRATGMTSDDGFTIGQVTPATFGLLFVGTVLGALGGGIYFALRRLMIGPRWFQVLSVATGAGGVVGSMLVHVEGVDFTLEPVWLAITLFVMIPFVYAALLTLLAERWLREDGWFMREQIWVALLPLALWIPIVPVLVALLVGWAVHAGIRRTTGDALRHPTWPWVARAALAGLFVMAVLDLVRDVGHLT